MNKVKEQAYEIVKLVTVVIDLFNCLSFTLDLKLCESKVFHSLVHHCTPVPWTWRH